MPYYTRAMVAYIKTLDGKNKKSKSVSGSKAKSSKKSSTSETGESSIISDVASDSNLSSRPSSKGQFSNGASSAKSSDPGSSLSENDDSSSASSGKKTSAKAPPLSNKIPKRAFRVTPKCVDPVAKTAGSHPVPKQCATTFDEKRLLYMKNLLRLQVERIRKLDGAIPAAKSKDYAKYEFNLNEPIKQTKQCSVYRAKHRDFPEVPMVVKVFDNLKKTVRNPNFLKILRHLGKKHPCITQTWDLFIDSKGRTLVVQEFANRGDLETHLAKNGCPQENQVAEWAHQLYKALDYLGDMGICHRSIKPRHVNLIHKDLSIRLSCFYDAVIYWDPKKEDVRNFPCLPMVRKNRNTPDFQAPEVFGDPEREEFDPVSADVWSYAANVFYMASEEYPYNFKLDNPKLEEEIQQNIKKVALSDEGRQFLAPMLNTNSMERITFERISSNPWFNKCRKEKSKTAIRR